jgi:hypothetical protein
MPKAYSEDLRVRVIEMVQAGASRREAAEEFSVSGGTGEAGRAVVFGDLGEGCGTAEPKVLNPATGLADGKRDDFSSDGDPASAY